MPASILSFQKSHALANSQRDTTFGKQSTARITFAATALVMLSVVTQVSAATYYVRLNGNDGRTGLSAANAFRTCGKAISVAVSGDTIYVGAGTFSETLTITRNGTSTTPIKFVGDKSGAQTGDAGTVQIRGKLTVTGNYVQVLDFKFTGTSDLVTFRDNLGGLMQGCEIVRGDNGLTLQNSQINLEQSIIRDSNNDGMRITGNVQVEVNQCTIQQCDDDGIDFPGDGLLTVRDTSIEDCASNGIEANQDARGAILVDRCRIFSNDRHGIDLGRRTVSLVCNTLIARNSRAGYNLDTRNSPTDEAGLLWHCTITHNGDQGIRNLGTKLVIMWNNIVSFNGDRAIEDTRDVIKEYNIFYGNRTGDSSASTGTNINNDPKFISARTHDYRLGLGSPAIDRAQVFSQTYSEFNEIPTPSVAVDLVNTGRPRGTASDIGCYEDVNNSSATFYVRTDGDDARSGTSASLAFRTVNKAASLVNPGDAVYIGAGVYRENPSITRAGTASKPIRFIGDVDGAKTGQAGAVVLAPPAKNTNNMSVTRAHYTEFHLLRFTGSDFPYDPNGSLSNGVYVNDTSSIIFSDCEFDHLCYGLKSDYSGVKLLDSRLHDIYWYPQLSFGGAIVENSEFSLSGNGLYAYRNHYFLMKSSRVIDNTGWALLIAPQPSGNTKPFGVNTPRVENSTIDRNGGGLYWAEADDDDRMSFSNTRFANVGSEMYLANCNLTVTDAWRAQWPIDKGVNGIITNQGNLTFDGFHAEGYKSGWGLLAYYGNVVVKGSTFRDCAYGVGFYYPTSLDLRDTNIVENRGTGSGGWGLYVWNKSDNPPNSTQITNCDISNNGNGAWFGWLNDDTIKLNNTSVTNNTGTGLQFHMSDVKFTPNTMGTRWKVANNGNGIVTVYGTALFDGITMADNTGWNAISYYGDVTVRNCTFKGTGDGFYSYYNKSFIAQNTQFSDNKGSWGLAYASNGTYHDGTNWVATTGMDDVTNCVIENNTNGVYLGNVKDNRVRFVNSPIRNNTNHGLYADGGELTFNAATVGTQWQITGNGNGITTYYGKFLFDSIEIADNKNWGVLTNFGDITVRNCRFTRNPSGGFQSYFNKSFKAENSKFDENAAWGLSYYSDGRYYGEKNGTWQWNTGATPGEFKDCVIEKNGYGMYVANCTDGTLRMVDTPIRSNTNHGLYVVSSELSFTPATMGTQWKLSDNGYGIATFYGKILFDGVEIADNRYWGALTYYGDITVRNSRFTRNPQGGFQSYFNKSFKAENSKFDENAAWGVSYYSDGRYYGYENGAWQWNTGATPGEFKDCVIEKNNYGMHVGNSTDGALRMVNSPIRSNTTHGLYVVSSDMSFTAATVGSKWLLSDNGYGITTYYGKILFDGVEIADNRYWGALTYYGDVTVRNSKFTRNPQGGLFSYYNKSFIADNSHFDENGSWGFGYHSDGKYYGFKDDAWGWYAADGPAQIMNCTISRNQANGMYVSNVTDSDIEVSNTQISGNGGIGVAFYNSTIKLSPATKGKWLVSNNVHGFHANTSNISVEDFEVTGNSQWGMYTYYSNVTLKNAKFNGNGHGMYWYSEPWSNGWDEKLTVENCQFNNNTTHHGLLTYYGPVEIKNSTFNGNKGDGLYTVYNKSCVADSCEMKGNGNWGVIYYVNFADWTAWDYKDLFQENVQSLTNCSVSGNTNGLFVYNAENRHFNAKQVTIDGNQTNGVYFNECRYVWDTPASDQVVIRNNGYGVTGIGSHLDLTLKNVVAENCREYGLLGYDGKFRAENCRVTGPNYVGFYSVRTTKAELANCRFDGAPRADGWGWASLTYGSSTDVRNCVFNGYPHGAYPYTYGDEQATPQPKFLNCTFANLDYWGFHLPNGQAEVRNCIFAGKAGNTDGYGMARAGGNLTHSNNLMYGFGAAYYNTTGTDVDILNNPRFVNATAGDVHLAQGSPAINTGTEAVRGLVDYDMDGNPRPSFKRWELGAYEYLNDAGSVRILNWSEKK